MHPYHKIFNIKLLKISLSSMQNKKSLIMSHNRKIYILGTKAMQLQRLMQGNGKCLLTNVIYRATVITSERSKQCLSSSGLTFKSRYTCINVLIKTVNTDYNLRLRNIFGILYKIEIKILALTGRFQQKQNKKSIQNMAALSAIWKNTRSHSLTQIQL